MPVGIAANKIEIIQAHQKHDMWCCFKGGHCFYLLCGATFPAKKVWKFFKTKFFPVMLSPIMCYQFLFTFFWKSTALQYWHCLKALSRSSEFLINVEQKKKSLNYQEWYFIRWRKIECEHGVQNLCVLWVKYFVILWGYWIA